ncbi:MAG: threonine synthase [Bacteroidetes bacterium]|nr:threonine synthase [Bacteroidota bacterium]MBU1113850.1 threonine synthase [Bacteroidota bacterium]MBU1799658.1 threonine synthase [Bacteroidota bacterium]
MKYYSTNNKKLNVSFQEAVMKGLSPDGGLFMPEFIPQLEDSFINSLSKYSIREIGLEVAKKFIGDEIPLNVLKNIIDDAINFDAPLVKLDDKISVLELFHGPTLAFKDFGARFMARTMGYFIRNSNEEINILVATSGDTGSAVASGFYGVEGINVYLLYPSGKVSEIQEKQLTTFDKNITAIEIEGTFDDCQKLVKTAFLDDEINLKMKLSSANSINIARLIPQSFYYFNAYKQITEKNKEIIFSIPSGNLGNLTAGLMAKKMGLPISKYIGATNSNSIFTEFIQSGKYEPRPSVKTISNAMDVGAPSNLARIESLYDEHLVILKDIASNTHNDMQTIDKMREIYQKYNYTIDPHGAVGLLALEQYVAEEKLDNYCGVVFETAHPAKFKDVVDGVLNTDIEIPEELQNSINKEKKSILLSSEYEVFKEYLLGI